MRDEELAQLEELLRKALDDKQIAGRSVNPSGRGKRYGTDLVRALDAVTVERDERTAARRTSSIATMLEGE